MKRIFLLVLCMMVGACTLPVKRIPVSIDHDMPKRPLYNFNEVHQNLKLLVLYKSDCFSCTKFVSDIIPRYWKTDQSNWLPMVRLDVTKKDTLYFVEKAYLEERIDFPKTLPTFVIWSGDMYTGHEVFRFTGYLNEAEFYKNVDLAIDLFIDGSR